MSLADVRSARSSPAPDSCPDCDTGASVTSDLHKYQVACTCKPSSVQYACADDPGPPAPAKNDTPPALPPRPPTNILATTNRRNNTSVGCQGNSVCRRRKYAWWCCGCGALAAALGGLLAAQHILLRAYTASPHHLETVPAAVPAAMLVLTGVCIMSLARRRNRYSYMIKVVGACCLVCALTCVLVTITTTVIHMNKLQTLKFCEYTKLTRTCTCFSVSPDAQHSPSDDDGSRCVFEGVSDCGVVHGALYWCLRGVFALSVSAVLVCIFSCMLAYQLLSHERKKMYWEQLELRCRSLYRAPGGPPPAAAGRPVQSSCSCCAQCGAGPAWDFSLQHRFWAPGRIGNLYSPNPGTGRKTSPWSWFPWPRGNSQNSRCRMGGVPQSGDSAYGFCETEQNQPGQSYDERPYPSNFDQFQRQNFPQNTAPFTPNTPNFPQAQNFIQTSANFGQSSNFQGYPQGTGFQAPGLSAREAGGSFDAQTGVWGPPPPYSPQGRSASRHHLHQDPATTTLLHHHIDPRTIHDHSIHDHPIHDHTMPHTCRNYHPQDIARINPDINRINPDLNRLNPDLNRTNPDLNRLNPELNRLNPDLNRINSELMYPNDPNDICLQEMVSVERFNTLRGHLVKYRGCQRSGVSSGNIHADCGEIAIECRHQKSASKVSDQSSDSCQKQGKENLGFQNDKHSPIRSSARSGRGVGAESEVYFADVSSCCNVSVQADCCINPNVSLVGTIETHPESTSESDTGSFTLTRQQRPQPQVGSKRRPRQTDKHTKSQEKIRQEFNNSIRLTEQQIEHLNSSMRIERMNEARISERMNEPRISDRMNESRISDRMNESRISDRMNESRINERMNEPRISDRMNEPRISDRMNEPRISDRMNESRISERMNESRISDRMNESRISDRMNESRISDRMNESRISDRMNESRISERMNEPRISDRMNESRISDRMTDIRMSDRMIDSRERLNDSRIERMNESRESRDSRDRLNERDRISERIIESDRSNDSRIDRNDSRDRLNDSRSIDRDRLNDRMNDSRTISERDRLSDSRPMSDRDRMNDSRVLSERDRLSDSRFEDRRLSDLNSSLRVEGSPKRSHMSPLRMPRTSPKERSDSKEFFIHNRQDSKEFFVQNLSPLSPLSPNTEESLLSSEGDRREETVYSNEPEASKSSKCLGPDSQYEPVREQEEILKLNHHHCYSDTNTMDSGWQSGSEKQVTD